MRSHPFLLSGVFAFAAPLALGQTVHTVPGDFPTIQAAIDAAVSPLDSVLVAPGVYVETIDFFAKDIAVTSSGGAGVTTIDGGGSGPVVTIHSGQTQIARLEGFTITGGVGPVGARRAGGISCRNASPTIDSCVITGNVALHPRAGGGLHSKDSNVVVADCTFSDNEGGSGAVAPAGPGAVFFGGDHNFVPTLVDCEFVSNRGGDLTTVFVGDAGPGAVDASNTSAIIERCMFRGNRGGDGLGTGSNGGTGALRHSGFSAQADVRDCQFIGNVGGDALAGSGREGGAGAVYTYARPSYSGCLFRANVGGSGGPLGNGEGGPGAMWISRAGVPRPEVIGCTFEDNQGGYGGDGFGDYGGAGAIKMRKTGVKVHNTTFEGNVGGSAGTNVDDQGGPGAIYFGRGGNGEAFLARCFFYANQGGPGGGDARGGAGVMFKPKTVMEPILVGCVLAENVAGPGAPGAIECAEGMTITNCTVVGNFGGVGAGGGIDLCGNANAVVTNTILWGNHGSGPGVDDNLNEVPGGSPGVFTYSLIGGGFAGVGNIDADPLFVDAAGRDFHLTCASPGREAGDNLAPWLSDLDVDGDARILGALVEIGVDEYNGVPSGTNYCLANPTSLGVSATIGAGGCNAIGDGILPLRAEPVPNTVGLFFYGTGSVQLPFGNGFRCAGGSTFRLPSTNAAGNVLATNIDYASQPNPAGEIVAGSTWFFQAWFRDPAGGGSLFNLSDGLEVTFVD